MKNLLLKNYFTLIVLLGAVTLISSCDKDENDDDYTVPSTYTFTDESGNSNVDYTGQTQRLDMLGEMVTYLKTANTPNTQLDAQKLKNMYRNENDPFSESSLNTSGKQIKDKVFAPDQALFEAWFDSIAIASQSTQPATDSTAGVSTSSNSSYLFSANGVEYTQLIEKGLMGALMYYQATDGYLGDDKMNVDNTTAVDHAAGKHYTQMEHHWDEAFGYFGVPVDFPGNTTGMPYWGKYSKDRNGQLGTATALMNAFLKGRAAISNNDLVTRDQQITIIREQWELVAAGTAIHYLNDAKTNFADDVLRNHQLSEAYAFIMSLKYNPAKKVSNDQINEWLNDLGLNFYNVTSNTLTTLRDEIAAAYELSDKKDQL